MLGVATATRVIDRTWYQWSFSSIKARIEHLAEEATAAAALDTPTVGGVDEPSEVVPPLDAVVSVTDAPMPLQSAPAGTAFGTLVHSVMERVDFTAPDVGRRAARALRRAAPLPGPRRSPPTCWPPGCSTPWARRSAGAWAIAACSTSSGSTGSTSSPSTSPSPPSTPGPSPRSWPVTSPPTTTCGRGSSEAASGAQRVDVAGLLTGSVDLVARTTDGRYWLADYKTNLISDGDYGRRSLTEAMAHHGYPLQATLYLVALHRFLRWRHGCRLRPRPHLDGAAYLFLRGMDPAAAPPGVGRGAPGVIWWRPPTAAIEELDRLLAGGAVRSGPHEHPGLALRRVRRGRRRGRRTRRVGPPSPFGDPTPARAPGRSSTHPPPTAGRGAVPVVAEPSAVDAAPGGALAVARGGGARPVRRSHRGRRSPGSSASPPPTASAPSKSPTRHLVLAVAFAARAPRHGHLSETLGRETARARRDSRAYAVVILDLDHFKRINDTYGHEAGDRVLVAVGELLRAHTREGDLVCRYGGEEFVVLMPGSSAVSAARRAEVWRAALEAQHFSLKGEDVVVTLSAGVACFPDDGSDGEAVLHAADEALYRAKGSGRNNVTTFSR